jgi:transposase InsO family protein
VLIELGVVEQRHRAVLEVVDGLPVTEVALRHGVTRQTVHRWLRRYAASGLAGLADASSRPASCPHQIPAHVEARVVEMRGLRPDWGPRTIAYHLAREGLEISRSAIYRCLVRQGLIAPQRRKRKRADYRRWERSRAMELWQMDVMGGVRLEGGREAKIVTGIDDHSRFCVCAKLTMRATARPVCEAFTVAMARHGIPEQVLTDNGKVFTARFGPGAGPVLFDRLCREHGVRHLLTAPRSPTTTGKVERFHKTLRAELLAGRVFASLGEAQRELDRWVHHYNSERPHQGVAMAVPAERFTSALDSPPAGVAAGAEERPEDAPLPRSQLRRVSREGRVSFEDRRYQVGAWLAGETVEVTACDGLLEVAHRGVLVASHVRRRNPKVIAAAPPPQAPRPPVPGGRPVLRKVGSNGGVSFAGTCYRAGNAHRGEQVELRLVGDRVEIAKDGALIKSWPARHDRFREHGAFSTPGGRPKRRNASPFSPPEDVTQLPEPMRNAGGET